MTIAVSDPAGAPVVRFIQDEPADEDFFQTHTRLAQAIVTAIRRNSEIKVVGLLGRWGSGKSTVAKKVVALLGDDSEPRFRLFSYDAWLHQSDPVRRSFLESLLHFLVASKAVEEGKWNDKLKELSGQIEDTELIETPSLSPDGRAIAFSLLPVPIGVGLLGVDTIKEAFSTDASTLGKWTLTLAVTLIVMPGIVWLFRYVLQRPWRNTFTRDGHPFRAAFWRIVDEDGSPTAVLRLFTNRAVTRSNTRTLRLNEPTSLEFGKVFQEIMREASRGDRRLVILIDNLDRIAEAEALQMWATIRSFFLASHETEGFRHEPFHPTVILPIDRHAIEQMFAASENGSGRDRATSFIDKTFDVTFEVTEPVSSDWRAFLEHQMAMVFGEAYQPQWGFWTRRLFEQELPSSQTVVTPREINKLLNRIGALYLQWQTEGIPVEVMALFVVRRKTIEKGLLEFLQSSQADIERVAPDWKRQLAALYYGVPVSKAAQVLLEQPIRQAVIDYDRDAFAGLAGIDGFGEIFEFVTANLPGISSSLPPFTLITNAALLLDSLSSTDGHWNVAAWHNLIQCYLELAEAIPASDSVPQRLQALANHASAGDRPAFIDLTAAGLRKLLGAAHERWELDKAIRVAASDLVVFAARHGEDEPEFHLEIEPAIFITKLNAARVYPRLWPQFRTTAEGEAMATALNEMLRSRPQQSAVPGAIGCLLTQAGMRVYGGDTQIDWDAVAEAAAEVVRRAQDFDASPFPAIRVMAQLIHTDRGRSLIVQLVNDGVLAARLDEALQQKSWTDFADVLALLIWRNGHFQAPNSMTWAQLLNANPDLPEQVIEAMRRMFPRAVVRALWGAHDANRGLTTDFLETVIGRFVASGNLGWFDSKEVIANLVRYKYAVPWRQRDKFLQLVEAQNSFWSEFESAPLGPHILEAAEFLERAGGEKADRAAAIVRQRVEDATIDEWKNAITSGAEPYGLGKKLIAAGAPPFSRKSSLFEALEATIGVLTSGADRDARMRWFELGDLLKVKTRRAVFESLADSLGNATPEQALHLLRSGGQQFLKLGFAQNPHSAVSNVVLKQLQKKDGRDWLRDNHEEVRGWVQRTGAEGRATIGEALLPLRRSKAEERRYSAEILSKHWDLEPLG